jgi:hypothetical protein
MKFAVEMGSRAMMYSYNPGFIKIASDIQKFLEENTQTQHGDHISLL